MAELVAIIGSADPARQYEPPIHDIPGAKVAAREIGAALARAGYKICVYSSQGGCFIEMDAVSGYISVGKARSGSIQVLCPDGCPGAAGFPDYAGHEELFEEIRDNGGNWQFSFYHSLRRIDHVVIIGGGQSTLIAGILAITYSIPLLALGRFGGRASTIWSYLVPGRDLPNEENVQKMAHPGTPQTADLWVSILAAQREEKRRRTKADRANSRAIVALTLLIAWAACFIAGSCIDGRVDSKARIGLKFAYACLLFLGPMLGGGSGATIRMLPPGALGEPRATAILGFAAGAITAILYMLGQWSGGSQQYGFFPLAVCLSLGWVAGYTSDAVFKKLETFETLRTDPFAQKKGNAEGARNPLGEFAVLSSERKRDSSEL